MGEAEEVRVKKAFSILLEMLGPEDVEPLLAELYDRRSMEEEMRQMRDQLEKAQREIKSLRESVMQSMQGPALPEMMPERPRFQRDIPVMRDGYN